jgi:hypothetical protein
MAAARAWLIAFLLTVAVEAPIVLLLTRASEVRAARRFALVVFAQLATHPLVWFLFPELVAVTGRATAALSEAWAWFGEAAFYALALRGVGPTRALATSALANGACVLAGLLSSHVGRALG